MTHQSGEVEEQPWGSFEEIATLLLAPITIASAEGVKHPSGRELLKAAITLQEQGKEAFAHLEEVIADLRAEVEAELAEQSETHPPSEISSPSHQQENSALAQTILNRITDLDTRIREATQGTVDARSLMPILLGGFALRQLVVKGLQLDDVPWYVLAWYSFDSFMKFHPQPSLTVGQSTPESPTQNGNASNPVDETLD
jgi:hypothetical protein